MLTILSSFAQEESRSVSENCKWRIRKKMEQGEIVGLRAMYGYIIHGKEIRIETRQLESESGRIGDPYRRDHGAEHQH